MGLTSGFGVACWHLFLFILAGVGVVSLRSAGPFCEDPAADRLYSPLHVSKAIGCYVLRGTLRAY